MRLSWVFKGEKYEFFNHREHRAHRERRFKHSYWKNHWGCYRGTPGIRTRSSNILAPIHEAQMLSYLKLSDYKIGLLINFNVKVLKEGIRRMRAWFFSVCSVLSVVKKIMDLWLGHVLLILELSCVYLNEMNYNWRQLSREIGSLKWTKSSVKQDKVQ